MLENQPQSDGRYNLQFYVLFRYDYELSSIVDKLGMPDSDHPIILICKLACTVAHVRYMLHGPVSHWYHPVFSANA